MQQKSLEALAFYIKLKKPKGLLDINFSSRFFYSLSVLDFKVLKRQNKLRW